QLSFCQLEVDAFRRALRSGQPMPNNRDQQFEVDRLGDVIVAAPLPRMDLVGSLRIGGDKNEWHGGRQVLIGSKSLQQSEARHIWQINVAEDEIGWLSQ